MNTIQPSDWPAKGLPNNLSENASILRGDVHLPLLVLRDAALTANIDAMADWCRKHGFELAPHGKTTMCPQIFERQMKAGAWGMTVATVSQVLVCVRAGIKRLLIANQVVGQGNLNSLAKAMNDDAELNVCCLVDSVECVEHLAGGLKQAGVRRPLDVLIEIGRTGWRTGARSPEAAQRVFYAVAANSGWLTFRGVEAFEGLAKNALEAREFLDGAVQTAETLGTVSAAGGLIFSAGGSSYLGPVSEAMRGLPSGWTRLLRSGCYVTHDHGIYAQQQETAPAADPSLPRFEAALELWAAVQSMPDPGVAIVSFGKRDCAYDISLPTPLDLAGAKITAINDQHAYLSYAEESKLEVGNLLRFGISHPCTAFDKWRVIPVVDDRYQIVDLYRTYF